MLPFGQKIATSYVKPATSKDCNVFPSHYMCRVFLSPGNYPAQDSLSRLRY
jgi:hypothetical protein